MLVPRGVADAPLRDFCDAPSWRMVTPDNMADVSAACFYMARELCKIATVPIGAIASSWGGARINPWMWAHAQAKIGQQAAVELVSLHGCDPYTAERVASGQWEKWWRDQTADKPGSEPWQAGSAAAWTPVPCIGSSEEWGVPALADYNGMVWYRHEFDLTPEQAKAAGALSLGLLDDVGRVWINGELMGANARALATQQRRRAACDIEGRTQRHDRQHAGQLCQ